MRTTSGFAKTKIDRGEISGVTTKESTALTLANKRIRELELAVEILRRGSRIEDLGQGRCRPKRIHPVIDTLVNAGLPAKFCCDVLNVSSPGYDKESKAPAFADQDA